jgi:hypothetical protein
MHRSPRRTTRQTFARLLVALVVTALIEGCASMRPMTRARAVEAAQRNVCGAPRSGRDSVCTVRAAEPIRGGYRVVLDRRPPAGNDRLAIEVRRGGDEIRVVPVDSTQTGSAPK